MDSPHSHISDRELLLHADAELSAARKASVRHHLASCQVCQDRQGALIHAGSDFVQWQQRNLEADIPPLQAAQAAFLHRLSQSAVQPKTRHRVWAAGAAVLLLCGGLMAWLSSSTPRQPGRAHWVPDSRWTPGAVRPVNRQNVCSLPDTTDGALITESIALQVFHRYGIRDPQPYSYEVDYLIPRELGGSNTPDNLWPQPYSTGVWNARVKDALEDRLRSMVCEGQLDLGSAQRDLARDWVAAYKKYFQTQTPLLDHLAFVKDRPWE